MYTKFFKTIKYTVEHPRFILWCHIVPFFFSNKKKIKTRKNSIVKSINSYETKSIQKFHDLPPYGAIKKIWGVLLYSLKKHIVML